MNHNFVIRILGLLLMALGLTMLLPAGVALWYGERTDAAGFGVSIVITLFTSLIMTTRKINSDKLRIKSSISIVVFCWLFFSFFGAAPFYFCDVLGFTDSIFETMSGFTTTGATVLLDIEELGKGILLWRSMTQWLGGMGIIVLSLAIMPLLGSVGAVLYRAEVPGPSADKLFPRLQATAKILWTVYVFFTLALIILLKIFGMDWFDAVCHAFTTLSTGGFSTRNASVAAFQSARIEWTIILFMFIGGANFSLHYRLFASGNLRGYFKNREFVFYLIVIGAAVAGICWEHGFLTELNIRRAFFQVMSILTTTGFVSDDFELWGPFAQFILFLLMFVGGCGGSTGGGVKVIRVLVMIKVALSQIAQVLHPQAVVFIKIGKTTIKEEIIGRVMGFIILYMMVLGLASAFLAFTGHDIITSFTAVASCLGNIGPGFGDVGAVDNYFTIHTASKWVLIFCMLAGRLELFTVLVLFSRGFWRK